MKGTVSVLVIGLLVIGGIVTWKLYAEHKAQLEARVQIEAEEHRRAVEESESRKKLMQPQVDWVEKNLDGLRFHAAWSELEADGQRSSTDIQSSVSATVDNPCSLQITTQGDAKLIPNIFFPDTIHDSETRDCKVNLTGLSHESVSVENDQSARAHPGTIHHWKVSFDDANAISCTFTHNGQQGVDTLHSFDLDFLSQHEAEQFSDGFKNMVSDYCPSRPL